MITRSSIAFEDFLGSSIAPQVMPPWLGLICFADSEAFYLVLSFLLVNNPKVVNKTNVIGNNKVVKVTRQENDKKSETQSQAGW